MRLSKTLAGLLIFAALFATAESLPASGDVSLPFSQANGCLVIEAQINGQAGSFILDTGASSTVIDPRFLSESYVLTFHPIETITGHSVIASASVSVSIGGKSTPISAAILKNAFISRAAGKPIDGLIGMDVLSQYQAIKLDFEKHVLILTERK